MPPFRKRKRSSWELLADYPAADRPVLTSLLANGADLGQPRQVLHYLYVHSAQHQTDAAALVRASGWEAEVRPQLPDYPNDWLVLAQDHAVVLSPTAVSEARTQFESLAAKFGGEYDGWEASV